MPFHQGSRLKKYIENSHLKVKVISEKSGVALSSLHDLYKKDEILRSRIKPILDVLGKNIEDFYKPNNSTEDNAPYGAKELAEALKRENELLRERNETLKKKVEALEKKVAALGKKK